MAPGSTAATEAETSCIGAAVARHAASTEIEDSFPDRSSVVSGRRAGRAVTRRAFTAGAFRNRNATNTYGAAGGASANRAVYCAAASSRFFAGAVANCDADDVASAVAAAYAIAVAIAVGVAIVIAVAIANVVARHYAGESSQSGMDLIPVHEKNNDKLKKKYDYFTRN